MRAGKVNDRLRYVGLLTVLVAAALLLMARLFYICLSEPLHFPINKVKIAATFAHVQHEELEQLLSSFLQASFFSLPVIQLQQALTAMEWVESASVERVWPDSLKITIVEKKPVAFWKDALLTENGQVFKPKVLETETKLPKLDGPDSLQLEVLQVYQKLSKILSNYGLYATGLQLRENEAWVLFLPNNVKIYLGKKELEARLLRFCRAYPAVFAQKIAQLRRVDLRYPRGMAVQWDKKTEQ